jgi:hypothetical protein
MSICFLHAVETKKRTGVNISSANSLFCVLFCVVVVVAENEGDAQTSDAIATRVSCSLGGSLLQRRFLQIVVGEEEMETGRDWYFPFQCCICNLFFFKRRWWSRGNSVPMPCVLLKLSPKFSAARTLVIYIWW